MHELWLLLLPVAALSGWLTARKGQREQRRECVGEAGPVYYRGLNHLLNEEPDKAIDAFVEMLEVDSDTVETHLALGNLFRRRGEVERAIRLHQNLIARPALTREQRAQALLELGQDYMRAGLLDRAENLFRELRDTRSHVKPALRNLLTIYETERDWEACLETSTQLENVEGKGRRMQRAHYHCELAVNAIAEGRIADAQASLKKAVAIDPSCVRAGHLQARQAAAQDDHNKAIRLLRQMVEQAPDYLPEVLGDIVNSYRVLGDSAALETYLHETAESHPGVGAELALADLLREREGEAAALEYLGAQLEKTPSLSLVLRSIELNARMPELDAHRFLSRLSPLVRQLLEQKPLYQCKHCGFAASMLHWQCPSCHRWGSVKRAPGCEAEIT